MWGGDEGEARAIDTHFKSPKRAREFQRVSVGSDEITHGTEAKSLAKRDTALSGHYAGHPSSCHKLEFLPPELPDLEP